MYGEKCTVVSLYYKRHGSPYIACKRPMGLQCSTVLSLASVALPHGKAPQSQVDPTTVKSLIVYQA